MKIFKFKIKNSIFSKLLLYFGISLLLFSLVVGGVFTHLFYRNVMNTNRLNLEARALKISEVVSKFWYFSETDRKDFLKREGFREEYKEKKETGDSSSEKGISENNSRRGRIKDSRSKKRESDENKSEKNDSDDSRFERRVNMRTIGDIAMAEVWIVDAQTGHIIRGKNKGNTPENFSTLPPNAEKVIHSALKGQTTTTENFNSYLDKQAITVAVPILNRSTNAVDGVVLLHYPVENVSSALKNGIYTVILSIVIALILAGIIAIFLSLSFTKPLNKIENAALQIAEGDYLIKTGVEQNDEIGVLAKTIDRLAEQLYTSSQESIRFEQMRKDFITNISHELRTPITVIRGSLEAICDGIITDREMIDEYHRQILSDSIHLQRLVNDLIDLTKLQNPDFSIEKESVNLTQIVNDAIRSMRQIAVRKNISIVSQITESNLIFEGDYDRIRQMIIILLDNAIKFSPENKSIAADLRKEENYSVLTISDEGKGISENDIDKIFNRYHKSNTEENRTGMGIGLAIAQQIAARHSIKISVNSIQDVKTTFTLSFPNKKTT